MAELGFWEGFTQILIVLIPTVFGSVFTKFIINSWQDKKEEFNLNKQKQDLRRKILNDYEEAYTKQAMIFNNFVDMLVKEYSTNYKLNSKNELSFSFLIPDTENEKPAIKFKKEFGEFNKQINENLRNIWRLFSTVRVYYSVDDINEIMTKISHLSNDDVDFVLLLLHSKNSKEFSINYKLHLTTFHNFRDAEHELSHLLATLEIKQPDIKKSKKSWFSKNN